MTETWKPQWIQRLDSEISGYEKERNKHQEMVTEYDKKLGELREKRKPWTEEADGG